MNILIRVLTNGNELKTFSALQWDELLRFARNGKLMATLSAMINKLGGQITPPKTALHLFAGEKVRFDYMLLQVERELYELEKAFKSTNFPIILLKGAAYIAADLKPAAGRLLSDIDILVPKRHLAEAEACLRKHGWQSDQDISAYDERYYRDWMHEIPPLRHPTRHLEVDMHYNLVPLTGRIKVDAEMLFSDAVKLPNSSFSVLSPVDRLLHSATHLLYNDELRGGIRDLADMRLLCLAEAHDSPFWKTLPERAKELNMERPLFYALDALERLFAYSVPSDAMLKCREFAPATLQLFIMRRLIDRVLAPKTVDQFYVPVSEWLLFVRSHWLRMPPVMLCKHLFHKWRTNTQ